MNRIYLIITLFIICAVLTFTGLTPNLNLTDVSLASFTLISFAEAGGGGGGYANVAGVADQHVTVLGDQILISKWNKIIGVAAFPGANCTGVRLNSPSLREVNPLQIAPFGVGIAPNVVPEVDLFPENPIELEENEGLECERVDAAATNHAIAVLLADQNPIPITGGIRQVRFQTTITPVDLTYVNAPIALVDYLPVGNYEVVGARLVMAGGAFFRLVAKEAGNRPGGCCAVLPSNQDAPHMRNGMLGTWLEFHTNNLPSIDVLSTTTPGAGTYEGVLDVIRVS